MHNGDAQLEGLWSQHLALARAAWPTLSWDSDAYKAWLLEQCANGELAARLPALDAAETLLCWSAGRGDVEAHRLFEVHYLQQVASAVKRFGTDASFVDEIAQRVRVKLLLTAPGQLAPIARYAFGGGLAGLVRVAAIREALTLRRLEKKPSEPPEVIEELVGEADPVLRVLKERYAREFRDAFAFAVAALTPKERHLLRLSLSGRASIDDIARMHHAHRATAARWLNAARDQLATHMRQYLQRTLGLDDGELQSLLRLIRTEAPRLLDSIPADTGIAFEGRVADVAKTSP